MVLPNDLTFVVFLSKKAPKEVSCLSSECRKFGPAPLDYADGSRRFPYNHAHTVRASNYIPRNQYRDRFFLENGTHTTIPGAIPKAQRSYTTPYSSKGQTQSPSYSQEREARLQEHEHSDHGYGYGIDGEEMRDAEERDQDKKSTWRRDLSRRNLAGTDTGPAVESPLSCVSEGDSVIFDISSGCYPVYEKDSLLNSNTE